MIPSLIRHFDIGSSKPKLLVLVDCSHPQAPLLTILGASAYAEPMSLGTTMRAFQSRIPAPQVEETEHLVIEQKNRQWGVRFGQHFCQQAGCLTCFLENLRVLDFCPWHRVEELHATQSSQQVLHLATLHAKCSLRTRSMFWGILTNFRSTANSFCFISSLNKSFSQSMTVSHLVESRSSNAWTQCVEGKPSL